MQTMFSAITPTYDLLNHVLSFGLDLRWRRQAVASLDLPVGGSPRVLDLCAGTGDFSLAVIKKYPNANIDVLDFSAPMLEKARQKLSTQQIHPINYVQADALKLPYAENTFDVALCGFGVRNFTDVQKGLREMFRVLKPGGQAMVLDLFKPVTCIGKCFYHTYGRFVLPCIGRLISRHPGAYDYLRRSVHGFVDVMRFGQLCVEMGFSDIRSHKCLFESAYFIRGTK